MRCTKAAEAVLAVASHAAAPAALPFVAGLPCGPSQTFGL